MKKIVFIGTPDFSVEALKALLKDSSTEISLVVTGEDRRRSRNKFLPTPVKKLALENNLEVYTPKNINDPESIQKIQEVDPDFIVIVAYGQILSNEFLEAFPDKILNIHSSLLPKYRGAAPINWALVDGEKETGVSIMIVDEGMDTGDVLISEKTEIPDDETADKLHDRLAIMGGELIVLSLKNFENLYENRQVQKDKEASYCGKITREMGHLDFNQKKHEIYNHFRGFYPWPGAYFYYDQDMVKVHKMDIISGYNEEDENGKVLKVSEKGIAVACEQGRVLFTEIQFPNRRTMKVKEFLLGNDFKEGIILE